MVETHDSHIHLSGHLHDKLSSPSSSREGCISSSIFSLISSTRARSLSSRATKIPSRCHEQNLAKTGLLLHSSLALVSN